MQQLKVGDPADKTTEVGPLIKPSEVARVGQWVDEAVAAGAKLLCGGQAIGETAYEPTVLLNPPARMLTETFSRCFLLNGMKNAFLTIYQPSPTIKENNPLHYNSQGSPPASRAGIGKGQSFSFPNPLNF